VDAEAFEEAAKGARRSKEPAAYEAALDLYAGELLPEDRYEEWAEGPRARLRGTYVSLLTELAGLYEERGDLGSAADLLGRLLAEEPTSGRLGPLKPRDRPAALPLAPHRRRAPLPRLPQARYHLARAAARGARLRCALSRHLSQHLSHPPRCARPAADF